MTTEHLITLIAAGLAFAASVISALVSVYNARFHRFAMERWWEKKVEAYTRIIDALSSLAYYYDERLEAEIEHRNIPESRIKEIDSHWERGYVETRRATAAGAFLISAATEEALNRFWREKERGVHPNDFFGMLDANAAAARDCLRAVVDAAKEDLRVRSARA